jgi:hypothetical protein
LTYRGIVYRMHYRVKRRINIEVFGVCTDSNKSTFSDEVTVDRYTVSGYTAGQK